jgi:SAM-dependent methyltransferase
MESMPSEGEMRATHSSIRRFTNVLLNEGPLAGLELALRRVALAVFGGHRVHYALIRMTDLLYDRIHGVDTGGLIDLPEMKGAGRIYISTAPRTWKLILRHLPIEPSRFTYIDLGCGKGRTLLLGAKWGFKRIIGVDIAPQLLEVARQNASRKGVSAELVCADVREFEFPTEPSVVFMYNPFYGDGMQRVAENLRDSLRRNPREVYVVYFSPKFGSVWKSLGFSVLRENAGLYPCYGIYRTS